MNEGNTVLTEATTWETTTGVDNCTIQWPGTGWYDWPYTYPRVYPTVYSYPITDDRHRDFSNWLKGYMDGCDKLSKQEVKRIRQRLNEL